MLIQGEIIVRDLLTMAVAEVGKTGEAAVDVAVKSTVNIAAKATGSITVNTAEEEVEEENAGNLTIAAGMTIHLPGPLRGIISVAGMGNLAGGSNSPCHMR